MAVYKKIQQSKPSYPHLERLLTVSFIISSLGLVAQSVEQRIEKKPTAVVSSPHMELVARLFFSVAQSVGQP